MIIGWLVAFFSSFLLCRYVVQHRRSAWLDLPGERSLHQVPVPRLGGVGIWSGVLLGAMCSYMKLASILDFYCVLAALLLWIVGLLDDKKDISPLLRLLVQVLAGSLAVYSVRDFFTMDTAIGWLCLAIAVLVVVWGVNLYNFMDGMDGLAGSMAVTGFSALGILGFLQGDTAFSGLCGLLVAANLAFLYYNWFPARIFMGDSGSTVSGFAMVTIGVAGWQRGLYPVWIPLLVFSPFWVDASVTLLRRLLREEKVWEAHRTHLYQRWVMAGYTHAQVTMAYGILMLVCAIWSVAWQVRAEDYNENAVLAFWVFLYVLLLLVSDKVLARYEQ